MDHHEQMDRLRTLDPMSAEWVTLLLLVVFAAIAYTNVNSPRKWRLLSQAMFRMRLGRQTLREEIDLRDRTFIGLILVAIAVLALFGWQAIIVAGLPKAPSYPQWVAMVALLLLGHGLVIRALAHVLAADQGLLEHLSTGLLLFILNGIVLLPVTMLMAYRPAWRPELLWVGMALVGVLLVYRWIRAVWIGLGEGAYLRYIILYLCAAEAVPVLLLFRALR